VCCGVCVRFSRRSFFSFLSFFFCALTHRLVTCLTHSHTQAPHVTPTRHPKESTHAHLTRFSLLLALSRICLAEGGNNKNNEAEKPHNRGGWARQNKSKQLFSSAQAAVLFSLCVFFPFSFFFQSSELGSAFFFCTALIREFPSFLLLSTVHSFLFG